MEYKKFVTLLYKGLYYSINNLKGPSQEYVNKKKVKLPEPAGIHHFSQILRRNFWFWTSIKPSFTQYSQTTKLMCALPVRVMNSSSTSGLIAFNFWPIWATTTTSMSSQPALWTMLSRSLHILIKKRRQFKASYTARIAWKLKTGSSSRISGLFRIGISRIS